MSTYNYSIANDTANALLNNGVLSAAISASTISVSLDTINSDGDIISIIFTSAISASEEITLTSLVNAHDGTLLDTIQPTKVSISGLDQDLSGRLVTRTAVTTAGWHYDVPHLTRKTSTNEYCFEDRDGNERGTVMITMYDALGNITTDGSICGKSKILIKLNQDIESNEDEHKLSDELSTLELEFKRQLELEKARKANIK